MQGPRAISFDKQEYRFLNKNLILRRNVENPFFVSTLYNRRTYRGYTVAVVM